MPDGMRNSREQQLYEMQRELDRAIEQLIEESVTESLYVRRSAKDLERHLAHTAGVVEGYAQHRTRIEVASHAVTDRLRLIVEFRIMDIGD
jgi:hypothetical protein